MQISTKTGVFQLLSVTHELEERNSTVEEKFTDLVQRNNALQEREKSLSQDLEAVTKYGGKDSRTQVSYIITSFTIKQSRPKNTLQ